MEEQRPVSRLAIAALALVILAAAGLRLWNLDGLPPGAWIDEAIEGLQATAMRKGERLPDTPIIPFPRWPVWCRIEVVATLLGGDTLGTIRVPAAIAGVLGVAFAFLAGRALAGTACGLGAAAFLAGSFWHVQYSRLAMPGVLSVMEGLIVAWLLLGRRVPGWIAGSFLAALCVAAPYGYAASLITPVAAAAILACRWIGEPRQRPMRSLLVPLFIGAAALVALMIIRRPESLQRSAELATSQHDPFASQLVGWVKSVAWSTIPGWGFWRHYPPGAARFNLIELSAVIAGAVAIWIAKPFVRWQRAAWTAWTALTVLPECLGGEAPHLMRGLPQLAPAAIAAGAAVGLLARSWPRLGPALAVLLLSSSIGLTSHRLFARFAHDPIVANWYLKPDRDVAEGLIAKAAAGPIALSPVFDYARTPVLLFFLSPAVSLKTIEMTSAPMYRMTLVESYSDPVSNQPFKVLFVSDRKAAGRPHFGLYSMDELLSRGRQAYESGRLEDARREFAAVARILPRAAAARAGLGMTLFHQGRFREAIPHLEYSLSCEPEDSMKVVLEGALLRARGSSPNLLR